MTASVTLTADGSLRMPPALAERYFPHGMLVPLRMGADLLLLPTRGAAAGGLLLKQRNFAGERSVLLLDYLDTPIIAGTRSAAWDESRGALRVALMPS